MAITAGEKAELRDEARYNKPGSLLMGRCLKFTIVIGGGVTGGLGAV